MQVWSEVTAGTFNFLLYLALYIGLGSLRANVQNLVIYTGIGIKCWTSMFMFCPTRQCGIRIFWFIVFGGASVIGPACLHQEGLVYMPGIDPSRKVAPACLCRVGLCPVRQCGISKKYCRDILVSCVQWGIWLDQHVYIRCTSVGSISNIGPACLSQVGLGVYCHVESASNIGL